MSIGTDFVFTSGKTALAASATKSMLLVKPASTRGFRLIGIDVSLDGNAAATALLVDLYRTTSTTAPAGTAVTGQEMNEEEAAPLTTGLGTITTEPSLTVLCSWLVQPLGGLVPLQFPLGREFAAKAGGQYLGVRITTGASETPDTVVNLYVEE